ncbi:MAG: transposase [Thermobifida fusca]|uniref:IS701 family transposase n=3 Tax=Nocardiopsidaceae TaxID=83676 RepID=UPI0021588991|nr:MULTISPECIES: transposase [Thermobifida]MDD6792143.1 transposase [Thermobifida fusca]
MNGSSQRAARVRHPSDKLVEHVCETAFSPFRRRRQREWGEVYVKGLLTTAGRKSIRSIASSAGMSSAEQNLHHFITNSTWDWKEVRRELARYADNAVAPVAWVVDPLVIQKAGEHSVGVRRTFVPGLGKTVQRQYVLGVWIASEKASVPVEWHMVLPDKWTSSESRRKVGTPGKACPSRSDCLREAIEELSRWGLRQRPVVMDAREVDPLPLIGKLAASSVPFLLRIREDTRLADLESGRFMAAAQLAELHKGASRPLLPAGSGAPRTPVCGLGLRVGAAGPVRTGPLLMAAQWTADPRAATMIWLTNMVDTPIPMLLGLGRALHWVRADRETCSRVGMRDFEGRSFPGWHRHMTLVSVAHTIAVLTRTGQQRQQWTRRTEARLGQLVH